MFDYKTALDSGYTPSEILDHIKSDPQPGDPDVDAARNAGYSDDDILKHELGNAPQQPTNALGAITSPEFGRKVHDGLAALIPGSFQRGVAHETDGAATTADVLGMPQTADYLHSQVNKDLLNAPTSQAALDADLKQGNYLHALTNIPGAIGESAGHMAADVGLAAAGTAAGATVGGPLGAVGGLAAGAGGSAILNIITQTGNLAKARAKADGRVDAQGNGQPNAQDVEVAIASSGALGLLNRLGLGEKAGSLLLDGVTKTLGLDAATGTASKLLGSTVVHAGSDAVQAAGQQAAETAGTQQGLTLDPSAIAGQAVTGAASRVALGGVRRAIDQVDGTQAARNNDALATKYNAMSPDEQNRVQNLAEASQDVMNARNAPRQNPVDPNSNQTTRGLLTNPGNPKDLAQSVVNHFDDHGVLTDQQTKDLTTLVKQAPNSQTPLDTQTIRDTIDNTNLPDDAKTHLANLVTQMDMQSSAKINNRDTSLAGDLAKHAFASLIPGGTMVQILASHAMNTTARRLGLSDPTLIREGKQAIAMLQAAGEPIPDTKKGLLDAISQVQTSTQAQAQALGLNPANYAPTPAVQSAQAQAQVQAGQAPNPAAPAPGSPQATLQAIQARAQVQQDAMQQQAAQQAGQPQAAPQPVQAPQQPQMAPQGPQAAPQPGQAPMAPTAPQAAPQAPMAPTAPQAAPQAPMVPPAVAAAQARAQLQPTQQAPPVNDGPLNGRTLSDWSYGVGRNLKQELLEAGAPKNLNYDLESTTAVQRLVQQGLLPPEFADRILNHGGRVTRDTYNLIRNEAFLAHGIDRRTMAAQEADPRN